MKKGMLVWIPVLAIHHDEKYYDNPEKFDPERFLNNKMRNSSCYMPFGLGPRSVYSSQICHVGNQSLAFSLISAM